MCLKLGRGSDDGIRRNRVKPHTVYVCEPQPVVLAGLKAVLHDCTDLELAGEATAITEAPLAVAQLKPEIVLLGHSANARAALADLPRVLESSPSSHIILWVSDAAELDCLRALQLGIKGVLRKTAALTSVLECLRAVAEGQIWLEEPNLDRTRADNRRMVPRMTPRERQIVELVCRGMKNKEIAAALSITPGTVKVHLMHIFEKTGVKDRFQLALHGRQLAGFGEPQHQHDNASGPAAITRIQSSGF
jgi:two-component system nitrate/nitrite response regulator NarL